MREGKRYDEACEICNLKIKSSSQKYDFLPAFCDAIFAQELSNPVANRAISQLEKF